VAELFVKVVSVITMAPVSSAAIAPPSVVAVLLVKTESATVSEAPGPL
jgi:hypothetical protein